MTKQNNTAKLTKGEFERLKQYYKTLKQVYVGADTVQEDRSLPPLYDLVINKYFFDGVRMLNPILNDENDVEAYQNTIASLDRAMVHFFLTDWFVCSGKSFCVDFLVFDFDLKKQFLYGSEYPRTWGFYDFEHFVITLKQQVMMQREAMLAYNPKYIIAADVMLDYVCEVGSLYDFGLAEQDEVGDIKNESSSLSALRYVLHFVNIMSSMMYCMRESDLSQISLDFGTMIACKVINDFGLKAQFPNFDSQILSLLKPSPLTEPFVAVIKKHFAELKMV